jgi:plasmid replication initiation protein
MKNPLQLDQQLVMISKPIIDAEYKFTVSEFNIFFCALGQLPQSKAIEPNTKITITVQQYAELRGVSIQTAIEALEEAREGLWRKWIVVKEAATGKNMRVRLLNKMEDKINSSLVMEFSPEFLVFICELKKYITIPLSVLGKFNRFYSYRLLFLILDQTLYKQRFCIQVSLIEFSCLLGLDDKYKNIAELRRRVIVPAITEITMNTDIDIELEYVKQGKKVVGLVFKGINHTKPKRSHKLKIIPEAGS